MPAEVTARLTQALIADARDEVRTATRVGVLIALDYHGEEIQRQLGIKPSELVRARASLKRALRRPEIESS